MIGLLAWLMLACAIVGDVRQPATEYLTKGGWGSLRIEDVGDDAGGQRVTIQALGANGHVCDLEGVLRDGRMPVGEEDSDHCMVLVTPNANGFSVTSDGTGGCRAWCGMRADFEGDYLRPQPGCSSSELERTRTVFKQQYDAGRYAQALATLRPTLKTCERTLLMFEEWEIRNDLAVTASHLGDVATCREALAPFMDSLDGDDHAWEELPPMEAGIYRDVLDAAAVNARLCRIRVR